ncbi:DUF3857 domain-containing protein [Flavobacterium sp. NST-5]|uniref:DUF3857 domain-containing protein n=1 Tax=Flavobacterium ichthyis TaxID=2698827 RepID=A0ABW9Z699_9FLAO|nr:DUF3857 domain-containing protein [Flavobacterium ichthyis]NBL63761.1 DUF3857 domain-containing protein [Flavobacterium ichthyis]
MKKLISLCLFISLTMSAQFNFQAEIPQNLKDGANACVRFEEVFIDVTSNKNMNIKSTRIVTVLNEAGLELIGASEFYNKSTRIKSMEAIIYNASGSEIKKIKRKDFRETSISEGSIITDNKVVFLDYTPVSYPFTVVFNSEIATSNTAFIPAWTPVKSYFESVENSKITVRALPELGFKYKAFNTDGVVTSQEISNGITFSLENFVAIKNEEYSPNPRNFLPNVLFGLSTFNLEGVDGTASSWDEFGKWVYNSLLEGTDELTVDTQLKIKTLVGEEKDPVKIARIVYDFVQSKTRYISIQLGIGGWKPMLAKDVDRLGYGDCKALSNYTRALLKVVGVPSYYTVIYGGQRRDLQENFVSMQGNHAILALPVNDKIYWLECTSQTNPFGYQGDFTDNRLALLVKPDGGQIVRTHEYITLENTQISTGNFSVSPEGNFRGEVNIKSRGTQYDNKAGNELKSNDDVMSFYKSYFRNINNLNIQKTNFVNNKNEVEYVEDLQLEAVKYADNVGGRMLIPVNAFNKLREIPQRYRTRNNPFELSRGFKDYDEITIEIPQGYTVEAKPDNVDLKDHFGHYIAEFNLVSPTKLIYKRTYVSNAGKYDKSEYENFRKFREQIARNDNAKIVLIKNQ